MKPQHSNFGAMSPAAPKFLEAVQRCQQELLVAVETFERETGRTVDALSMHWLDVTRLQDQQPRAIRTPMISWLAMPGEFDR